MLAAMPPSPTFSALPGDASDGSGGERPEPPAGARSRRSEAGDQCPGALRLHAADDGALARIRVPGGVLDAGGTEVLAEVARRLGDGDVHLTSRGNVQIRGLGEECGGELAALLRASGLLPSERHERVRNVVASPLSGLDGRGVRDVRPWLVALDALVCASEAAAGLSGRFLFALDDGRGDMDALGADVTLRALDGGDAALRVGPVRDALRVPDADAPRAALAAAEAFLDAARPTGAWRVADLADGARPVLDALARRLRRDGVPFTPTTLPAPEIDGTSGTPPTGLVRGPDGSVSLSVGVPLGRLRGAQWRLLADLAREHGSGGLRLTPWRGVIVPDVAAGRADAALEALHAAGLVTGPGSPWTGVGACAGRPGCARSRADVRAEAAAALGAVGPLPVYWSGCERRCGRPRGTWVDVLALGDGHRVTRVRDGVPGASADVPDDPSALAAAIAAARAADG
ncbi:precorrin-3B synthase [Streptomyces sp. NPDC059783]|uniref:precorrin-3B synthase n=1 Tax=Streptomyces sp. NPDC059783 TaxID=3346944 RepID=UPI003646A215